jgi:anti-anti-sigma factor
VRHQADRVCVVEASGELDLSVGRELHGIVERELSAGPHVLVFDLTHCSFLDSSAIAPLAAAHRLAAANTPVTRILLVGASCHHSVERALELTGISTVYPEYPTVSAALAAARAS